MAVADLPAMGLSGAALYARWKGMIRRCDDPKYRYWPAYGGRGITVCARWRGKGGFRRWLEDMGGPPPPGMSIDRIDNDGNYEPGNCRWAMPAEQNRNQRPRAKVIDRERVIRLYAEGQSADEVALACDTTRGYVLKLASRARRETTGTHGSSGLRRQAQGTASA